MISRLIHSGLIIILISFQIVWANWLNWATPELFLAGLLAICMSGDLLDTLWWLVLGGILLDLSIGSTPGLYLLVLSLLCVVLLTLGRQVLHRPPILVSFVVFLAFATIFELIFSLVYQSMHFYLLVPAILTAMLATLFYSLLSSLGRKREVIQLG